MPQSTVLNWWLSAPQRLWARWVVGLVPTPQSWPRPLDHDRLGIPEGVTLSRPVSDGLALDHYRRRQFWRTAVGSEMFRFKYRGDIDAGWRLVVAAGRFLAEKKVADRIDLIVPVPSAPVFREFSPSQWLAEKLSAEIGKPVLADIFTRVRLGARQKDIRSVVAKKENISGMFVIAESRRTNILARRVLLIDDICDSGHTLAELQRILTKAGAAEVIPFAFAHLGRPGKRK